MRSSALCSRRRTTVRSLGLTASTALKGRARRRFGERAAPTDDDLVRVVGVPLVADVVGSEEAAELRLPPQALLTALIARSLVHGRQG